MLENGWKCILNCVSWFVIIILNFNALGDAYTIWRHYTVLLKSNRICLRLIFGIIFEITFFYGFQRSWRSFMTLFCQFFKSSTSAWRNSVLNFFIQALKLFKFYLIIFLLESVHNPCEVHHLFFFFLIMSWLWEKKIILTKFKILSAYSFYHICI